MLKSHIARSKVETPSQVFAIPRTGVLEKETKAEEKCQELEKGLAP